MSEEQQLPFLPTPEQRPGFEEAERLQANIDRLLSAIGNRGFCIACNAPIVWVRHANNKRAPYNQDAVNHFVTCPHRERFRTQTRRTPDGEGELEERTTRWKPPRRD